MSQSYFLQKRNYCRLISLLFLFFICCQVTAQKNTSAYRASLFRKNMDSAMRPYAEVRPYYITAWEGKMPGSIKVIRQLNENMAIIAINSQAAFDLMKEQIKIAPANDHWKLSPIADQLVESNNTIKQQYILSGLRTDELMTKLK